MELEKILDDILDDIRESDQAKKKLIHSLGDLLDLIKENEMIRMCVNEFMLKALEDNSNDKPTEYQMGYVAAAANLAEMIEIAIKESDVAKEDTDSIKNEVDKEKGYEKFK